MSIKLRLFFLLLICTPSLLFAADKLVFAIDIIRHGDRTPIQSLPTINYQWKEGLGQLTAEGMQQEYEMGVKFRKKYIEQTHLLPEHYEFGTIYVRSTDFERTLMSAESLLLGLYPHGTGPDTTNSGKSALPHAYQPIPIFSAPSMYDDVISKHITHEERNRLMQRYVYSTKEWQQKNNELQSKYPLWSRLTGINIKSLDDLESIGDALYIHQIHHVPMPEGLSTKDIETIIDTSNWVFMWEEKPLRVATVYSAQLMKNVANYLKQGSQKSKLKYVLLSAHDDTIASALSYMGAPINTVPPYTSTLNFSLYENGQNHFTVKITYNDSLVFIPACGGMVCDLQKFIELAMG
jgi:acid phosphatase